MVRITLTVNGEAVTAEVEPRTHLADFLREQLLLTGTHIGCEHGICGACTVLIDGAPARACIAFTATLDGAEITTIEGFDDDPTMIALRDAFSAEHALQCGYCTPGMLVMARDVVHRLPGAGGDRIRKEMSGNLCRCTGYRGIIAAVHEVAAKGEGAAEAKSPPRPSAVPPPPHAEAPPAVAPVAPVAQAMDESGMTRIEDSFTVGHPRDRVWAFFAETARVAQCMPGAQVTAVDGGHIDGGIRIKLGPMKAAFAGEGDVTRDDASYSGTIAGRGLDRGSSSRATGRVTYRLSEIDDGRATRVDIAVAYALTGPLAQFSRGGIARDLAARLTATFAENLEHALTTGEAPAINGEGDGGLDALSLVLAMVRGWFARLLGWR